MYSWSNPNQSQATSAALSSQYRVQAGDIGQVLGAILRQREIQQQLQQQQQQNMAKGFQEFGQKQQQNQDQSQLAGYMNDYRQAQLAGDMNPDMSDYFTQFDNPSAKAQLGAQQFLGSQDQQALHNQLLQAQIDAERAHANALWTYPPGSSNGDASMTPRQQVSTANDAQRAAGDYYDQFGIPSSVINSTTAIHAPSDTPYQYGPPDASGKPTGPATTVPQGEYLIVDPKTGAYQYVTPDYLNQARGALGQYQQAQANYRNSVGIGAQSPSSPSALPTAQSGNTDAYNQAVQALQAKGMPVTNANIQYVMQQLVGQ